MRWLFFSPVVFLFYAGICFYVGKRFFNFLSHFLPKLKALIFWLSYAFLCCAIIAVNLFRNNILFLQQANFIWMVVLLYLMLPFVIFDLIKLILFLFKKKMKNYSVYTTGVSIALCAIVITGGVINAYTVRTVNYNLTLQGYGNDIRIALVSDLHIGQQIGASFMEKVVDAVNRAEPDLVCIAGDIFNGNLDVINDLPDVIFQLRRIIAPAGVYAVPGNHDVDRTRGNTERIAKIMNAANIVLLQDEVHTIRENLHLAGRKDARPIGAGSARKTPQELCAGFIGTIIMMDHQPVQYPLIEQAGVDLVFSGHTHRGQIFPGNLVTRLIFSAAGAAHYGYWKGETMQAVITSGAGFWGPPLRVATKSEIAVINISFML